MNAKDLKKKSGTDWERLANMKDEEIDYSEIPRLDEEFFKKGRLRMPEKQPVTVFFRRSTGPLRKQESGASQ
jgi:hypothetical protein